MLRPLLDHLSWSFRSCYNESSSGSDVFNYFPTICNYFSTIATISNYFQLCATQSPSLTPSAHINQPLQFTNTRFALYSAIENDLHWFPPMAVLSNVPDLIELNLCRGQRVIITIIITRIIQRYISSVPTKGLNIRIILWKSHSNWSKFPEYLIIFPNIQ